MTETLTTAAVTIAVVMGITWMISGPTRNASIVDLVWGLGFVLVAWTVLLRSAPVGSRGWLLAGLTSLWGLRLTAHLSWRNLGKGEDYRYRAMREKRGPRFFWLSLFTVFLLQGALMWVVSLPVQAGIAGGDPLDRLGWLDALGTLVWAVGLVFETTADLQLARFKAISANKDRVMDRGLWRYSRHPNYFGDFCVWWGLYLIALAGGGWWTVVGPVVMTALLMSYSGAGLLEKTIGSRRPGYDDYVLRTNRFFPGPPRRAKAGN
jgi:steroid 5-alpha reductase family enzyme